MKEFSDKGISVIVCSISEERLAGLKENIAATISENCPYEVVGIDNTSSPRSIAAVYNDGASRARYPYLVFIHEDAGFLTHGWDRLLSAKLAEPDTGVIGFAGGKVMLDAPGGWNMVADAARINLIECGRENRTGMDREPDCPFTEVVALDGFLMAVRREVWEEHPFDEEAITGFHCYDVDFSLGIGGNRRNYVCRDIEVFHNSPGHFGAEWTAATQRLYLDKWQGRQLPRFASDYLISPRQQAEHTERVLFRFIKGAAKCGLKADRRITDSFFSCKMSLRHLRHLIKYPLLRLRKS